jgi:predicted transcriptional regulator YheO
MKLIAEHFGENCEITLHDWSKGYEHTIVAIENGHVTDRTTGDCGSNLGLEVMRGTVKDGDRYNYITQTKKGSTLRSSTIYLKNDDGESIGALCINLDISELIFMKNIVDNLTNVSNDTKEVFANDVSEVLDFLLSESLRIVGKPVKNMIKDDKLQAIKYLDEKGAFLISKSGNKVCEFYDISKFTLYNYLDEIRSHNNQNHNRNGNHD